MSIDADPFSGEPPLNSEPLTIDRLTAKHSKEYAEGQAVDTGYLQQTGFVSTQSSISVSEASFIPAATTLFQANAKAPEVSFEKPLVTPSLYLFSPTCIIPSIGSEQLRDVKIESVRYQQENLEAMGSLSPELARKLEEARTLLSAFEEIGKLDTMQQFIQGRLHQFTRG